MNHEAGPQTAQEEYISQHLRDVLATDPRVSELGIAVDVVGGHVYLSGEVATAERRRAIAAVVAEALPGHELHNDVGVTSLSPADGMEVLP